MVRQIVLEDVSPEVLFVPVGQRIELPDPPPIVALELGRVPPHGRLLAPDPGDPGIDIGQRRLERAHLCLATAAGGGPWLVWTGGVERIELDREPLLESVPGFQRLCEQDAGIDREGANRGGPTGEL